MRKARFEPEGELWSESPAPVADSIIERPRNSTPKFVPDQELSDFSSPAMEVTQPQSEPRSQSSETDQASDPDPSWRDEVASRVNRYRAKRRPQKPRFPSLNLKFETSDAIYGASATRDSVAADHEPKVFTPDPPVSDPRTSEPPRPETGRLIEFPRLTSFAASSTELADPVIEIPRILEAPESAPPPPAMGGILIESPQSQIAEKRPGIEIPLQLASMSRRLAASLCDATLVLLGFGVFAGIFYRITGTVPELPLAVESALPVLAILWCGYQYLNLVHTGTTPGLRLMRLQLHCFDGSIVPVRKRRWRVFASVLSLASLGLGYAWSLIDEDQLCWHDRVTATHIAPHPGHS
ncbi:MAG TPA: RDD family protein [Terriglobales bacterium]|nr:RDD family protein [Terriglobales bacterium]